MPGGGRDDGEAQHDQGGGVVNEAFALQQHDDAPGEADFLGQGRDRDGIRRADDGPPGAKAALAQVEAGDEEHGQCRDASGGEEHKSDGKEEDRTAVGPEFLPRRLPRGTVEKRRQKEEEDEARFELHGLQTGENADGGQEGDGQPADDHHDGVGDAELGGQECEDDNGKHEDGDGGDGVHGFGVSGVGDGRRITDLGDGVSRRRMWKSPR